MNKTSIKRQVTLSMMVVIMSILQQSCVYEKMTHLTEDDMEWVNGFNKGDSFLFVSNYGHIDTLYITDKRTENSKSPFHGIRRNLFDDYEAFARYEFEIKKQQKNFRDNIHGSLTIVRHVDDDRLGYSTDFDKRYSKYNYHIDIYDNNFKEFDLFKEYDPDIQDYLIIDDNNSMYSIYDKNIDNKIMKYIFNTKYGLIYYSYENGEEFYRKDIFENFGNETPYMN